MCHVKGVNASWLWCIHDCQIQPGFRGSDLGRFGDENELQLAILLGSLSLETAKIVHLSVQTASKVRQGYATVVTYSSEDWTKLLSFLHTKLRLPEPVSSLDNLHLSPATGFHNLQSRWSFMLFFSSSLDYCNALFTCFSKTSLDCLQVVLCQVFREKTCNTNPLYTGSSTNTEFNSGFLWLISCMVRHLSTLDMYCDFRSLRSSDQSLLMAPSSRHKAKRNLAPRLWNSLQLDLKSSSIPIHSDLPMSPTHPPCWGAWYCYKSPTL